MTPVFVVARSGAPAQGEARLGRTPSHAEPAVLAAKLPFSATRAGGKAPRRSSFLEAKNLHRVLEEDLVLVGLRVVEGVDELGHEPHLHRPLQRRIRPEHDMIRAGKVDPSWNLVKVTRRGNGIVGESVTVDRVETGFLFKMR